MAKRKRPADHGPRTRKYYQELGYMVGKVDCTGSRRRPSHDLFGIADLIGFKTDEDDHLVVVLIQYTNRSSHAKHRNKILMSAKAHEVARQFDGHVHIDLVSWKIMAGDRKYTPWVEDMNQTIMEQP